MSGQVTRPSRLPPANPSNEAQSRMSLIQAYSLASTARRKLSLEASHEDVELRRLVGHANLLDLLVDDLENLELQAATRPQPSAAQEQPKPIKHASSEVQAHDFAYSDAAHLSDSDGSDSHSDEDEDERHGGTLTVSAPSR